MSDTPAILIYATYRIEADDVDAFRRIAFRMAEAARARDGCQFLDTAEDTEERGTFRFVEAWRDQAALDAHLASPEFRSVLKEAGALGIVDQQADCYAIAGKSKLEMPS